MSLLKCAVSDLFSNTASDGVASSDELMNRKGVSSQILNLKILPYDQLSILFFFKCMICIFQKKNCYIGKLSHFWCVQRVEIDSREPVMFSEFRLSLP